MSRTDDPEQFSLSRWSRLKREAAESSREVAHAPAETGPTADKSATDAAKVELPPPESLTMESDFTIFMRPEVDESVRRAAVKQLFRDRHFNMMDGLDVYIDDYGKPDPIPPAMLARLQELARKLEGRSGETEKTAKESADVEPAAATTMAEPPADSQSSEASSSAPDAPPIDAPNPKS